MNVVFVEAKSFTRRWPDYLTEDEFREFQNYRANCKSPNSVIPATLLGGNPVCNSLKSWMPDKSIRA
jgi:hypothetical protein